MKSFTFTVPGLPKGQPRPRAFARRMPGGGFAARVYEAGTAEAWKSAIAMAAKVAGAAGQNLESPIRFSLTCVFQRPKSHYGSGKNSQMLKDSAPKAHIQTPDLDNLAKAAKDALTQIGVWRDDSQVVTERISKFWGDANLSEIQITEAAE